MSRDLAAAREAYKEGDEEASRAAHTFSFAAEKHKTSKGQYIKSVVYGGLDGIVTTFSIVASVAGAGYHIGIVIIMGFANVLADAISMGMGDALSSQAELAFAKAERKRELWECENYLEGEQREMIELYEQRGLSKEDAETLVGVLSKYKEIFVDLMMVEELGLMPPDEDESPWKDGLVTFCSFVICGCIPLIVYIIVVASASMDPQIPFAISAVVTGLTLFTLGSVKSKFTSERWWVAGLLMLLNGSIAAGAAYFISWVLRIVIGV